MKEHKVKLKAWKKELGEANKENIKLRKKFDKFVTEKHPQPESSPPPFIAQEESLAMQNQEPHVVSSICSIPILDFKP